jgi:hypothetical protein
MQKMKDGAIAQDEIVDVLILTVFEEKSTSPDSSRSQI